MDLSQSIVFNGFSARTAYLYIRLIQARLMSQSIFHPALHYMSYLIYAQVYSHGPPLIFDFDLKTIFIHVKSTLIRNLGTAQRDVSKHGITKFNVLVPQNVHNKLKYKLFIYTKNLPPSISAGNVV